MIVVGNAVLSDDIAEKAFICDLLKCKGACCAEGDAGAPVLENEIAEMEQALEEVLPYMSEKGRQVVASKGVVVNDFEGDLTTPLIEGKECAFAFKDKTSTWKCAFEAAYIEGKTKFYKPISCHLYPIRAQQYDHYYALNYHRWHICKPACEKGDALQVPVYKFLQKPLERMFGSEWFSELETQIAEKKKSKL